MKNAVFTFLLLSLIGIGIVPAVTEASTTKENFLNAARKGHLSDLKKYWAQYKELGGRIDDRNEVAFHHKLKQDYNALLLATDGQHLEAMKYLVEKGASVNWDYGSPLSICIEENKPKAFDYLLSLPKINVNSRPGNDAPLLHLACKKGRTAFVEKLVDKGADVDAKTWDGNLPLHIACEIGDVKMVNKLLSKNKANVNALGDCDKTPLSIAAEAGKGDVVKFLMENGADRTLVDNVNPGTNETPLMKARGGAVVGYLLGIGLEAGLSKKLAAENEEYINMRDKNGNTALHFFCKNGDDDAVKVLMENNPKAKENVRIRGEGYTPLMLALDHWSKKAVRSLVAGEKAETFKAGLNPDQYEKLLKYMKN